MKKIISEVLLVSGLLIGGTNLVYASPSTYKPVDSEKKSVAESDAKIRFIGDESFVDIPDPLDPEVPIKPVDPINPSEENLRITYVSNFNFNQRAISQLTEKTAFAESVEINSVFEGKGEEQTNKLLGDPRKKDVRETVPFISTYDARKTYLYSGWDLSVKQTPFVLSKDKRTELKGASIVLVNSQYVQKNQPNEVMPILDGKAAVKVAPVKYNGDQVPADYNMFLKNLDKGFKIGSQSSNLVTTQPTNKNGVGGFSLAFGSDLMEDENELSNSMKKSGNQARKFASTNGVVLRVPAKTAIEFSSKNEDSPSRYVETDSDAFYRTVVTWTLNPIPAVIT